MSVKFNMKKGDQIKVIAGKERGKTGKILRVIPKKKSVVVEKINMVKRHSRPTAKARQGGIIEKEAPLHISNVIVICSKCNASVKVGRKLLEDGKRVRYCKKCGELIDL